MLITIDDATDLLVSANRSTPIGITYLVEPRHRKTNNPFYDGKNWSIEKIGELVGMTGVSYESSVNNQRAREESETDFEAFPLWNGKGIHLNKFLAKHTDNGKVYLKVMPQSVKLDESVYGVRATVQYRWKMNQVPLTKQEIETLSQFEPAKSVSSRQETEKPVFWQTICLNNILQLRFGGECYEIKK